MDKWVRRVEDVDSDERNGHGWARSIEKLHRDEREDLKM
jgi:hypothetical protein